jgi:hypothetical protein
VREPGGGSGPLVPDNRGGGLEPLEDTNMIQYISTRDEMVNGGRITAW